MVFTYTLSPDTGKHICSETEKKNDRDMGTIMVLIPLLDTQRMTVHGWEEGGGGRRTGFQGLNREECKLYNCADN